MHIDVKIDVFKKYFNMMLFSAVILSSGVPLSTLKLAPKESFPEITSPQKIFLFGGFQGDSISYGSHLSYNDVWDSNGSMWSRVTGNARWHSRAGFASAYFQNKLWIFGGITTPPSAGVILDDVWSSSDGINWTEVTPHAPWGKRRYFDALVFNNKLWIFAGTSDENGGVWSSSDGVNWTKVLNNTPWFARDKAGAVVYNGKMWLMGGFNYEPVEGSLNDVWSSPDGINWTQATSRASWTPRVGLASTVYGGKMWILGGRDEFALPYGDLNDSWYSIDGENWTRATANAPWRPRNFFKALSFSNKLWIFGGGYTTAALPRVDLNDVWSSTDGVNWTPTTNAPWQVRDSYGAVVTPSTFGQSFQNPN